MNRLIEWWARNPVAANLLMVGIFEAGVIGFCSESREPVLADHNEVHDVFLRDQGAATTVRVSVKD